MRVWQRCTLYVISIYAALGLVAILLLVVLLLDSAAVGRLDGNNIGEVLASVHAGLHNAVLLWVCFVGV